MHVLAMGDQTFLGRWAIVVFVRDCPFIVVLNAPFRPLGLLMFLVALHLHYFYLFSHFLLLFPLFTR